MDGRGFRPADNIQRHGLVRVAPEAANLKLEISGVQGISECRRRLHQTLESEHALILARAAATVPRGTEFLDAETGG